METQGMVLPERPHELKQIPRLAIQPQQRQQDQILLTREQRHYLERVRRLRSGDAVLIFDGSGQLWLARLGLDSLTVEEQMIPQQRELPVRVQMGIAVCKGDGFDETIRQLTELGISSITPLLTERTQVDPRQTKLQRWQRIAQEAAEQCERLQIPVVAPPLSWSAWLSSSPPTPFLIASERREAPHLLQLIQSWSSWPPHLAIAIGPEGGWSDTELDQGQEQGASLVALGTRILRADTAAVTAASLVAGVAESQP
jgi:16S rRNA (uracil1498-N3)-methyltransferase